MSAPDLFAVYLSDVLDATQGDKLLTEIDDGRRALAVSLIALKTARGDSQLLTPDALMREVARLCGEEQAERDPVLEALEEDGAARGRREVLDALERLTEDHKPSEVGHVLPDWIAEQRKAVRS